MLHISMFLLNSIVLLTQTSKLKSVAQTSPELRFIHPTPGCHTGKLGTFRLNPIPLPLSPHFYRLVILLLSSCLVAQAKTGGHLTSPFIVLLSTSNQIPNPLVLMPKYFSCSFFLLHHHCHCPGPVSHYFSCLDYCSDFFKLDLPPDSGLALHSIPHICHESI